MGLWLLQIYNAVGNQEWLRTADHDQHVSDGDMVSLWDYLLVLRQEVQNLDAQLQGAPHVMD